MFIILISVHFIVFIGIAVIQLSSIYMLWLWSFWHLILSQQFFIPVISGQKSPQLNIMELELTGIYQYFFWLLFFLINMFKQSSKLYTRTFAHWSLHRSLPFPGYKFCETFLAQCVLIVVLMAITEQHYI